MVEMHKRAGGSVVAAIVQARMGSNRLPGKTLTLIHGRPLLGHVIDRLRLSRYIDKIVIATTEDAADDAVVAFAEAEGVGIYRGSVQDVLDRYYQAAKLHDADIVVRITADDPFKDTIEMDRVIETYLAGEGEIDYVSNWLKPTYPEGLDTEAFSFAALERAWREADAPFQREHVTPYIWQQPDHFQLAGVEFPRDLSHHRWTIDTAADLEFTNRVFDALYRGAPPSMEEILQLLDSKPELQEINSGTARLAGLKASVDGAATPPKG